MGICVSRRLRLMMNSMRKRTVSVQTQTKQNIQRSTLVFVMFVVNHLIRENMFQKLQSVETVINVATYQIYDRSANILRNC